MYVCFYCRQTFYLITSKEMICKLLSRISLGVVNVFSCLQHLGLLCLLTLNHFYPLCYNDEDLTLLWLRL